MTATEGHDGWYTMHLTLDNSTDYTLILNNEGQGKELDKVTLSTKGKAEAEMGIRDRYTDNLAQYLTQQLSEHKRNDNKHHIPQQLVIPHPAIIYPVSYTHLTKLYHLKRCLHLSRCRYHCKINHAVFYKIGRAHV